jgi:hypothetical protein
MNPRIMIRFLKPHTKKWFGALAATNVWRAALTMEVIRWARNKKVCSVCGNKQVKDYRFTKLRFGLEPATMRLCRTCFDDHSALHKELPLRLGV